MNSFDSASAEQKSPSIQLESGKLYELVATLKEYSAQDYITVAVELPSGQFLAPIPSQQLFVGELNKIKHIVCILHVLSSSAHIFSQKGVVCFYPKARASFIYQARSTFAGAIAQPKFVLPPPPTPPQVVFRGGHKYRLNMPKCAGASCIKLLVTF